MQISISHFSLRKTALYFAAISAISWASFSCKKDMLITNSSAKLSFSQNQLLFDTVFTSIGSTFQYFTIHNYHNQPIKISSVNLVGSYKSPFKINIDGTPGTSFSNITIPANDSIFVFVTVTIDPNNTNNPVVISDSLQFVTNGNTQYVDLIAWGQDAYFYRPNVFPKQGPSYSIVTCNSVWTNDKPHVVFGYLVVDSGCTLTMQPGTRVYMHNNGVLWIYKGGTLNIQGSQSSPVTIQGDRLEPAYQTEPGQWGEIWLSPGCLSSTIQWAIIKNGTIGIEADTVANWTNPTLNISHTIIKSMSNIGLLGQGSYITGYDNVVADCQNYCVDFSLGGSYSMVQSTFANYWSYGQRQTTTLLVNNWYEDIYGNYQSRPLTKAFFGNCIIWGSLTEELQLDSSHGGTQPFKYYFENCDLLTKLNTSVTYHYTADSTYSSDPHFNNTGNDDYSIPKGMLFNDGNSSICNSYWTQYGTSADLNNNQFVCPANLGAYSSN
ncbi:MAG TPA: hypothetical protein VN922_07455 [Bacteroidia bacterium]|nr:hypothetical protein [Bacteroidia bacterium]